MKFILFDCEFNFIYIKEAVIDKTRLFERGTTIVQQSNFLETVRFFMFLCLQF